MNQYIVKCPNGVHVADWQVFIKELKSVETDRYTAVKPAFYAYRAIASKQSRKLRKGYSQKFNTALEKLCGDDKIALREIGLYFSNLLHYSE